MAIAGCPDAGKVVVIESSPTVASRAVDAVAGPVVVGNLNH